MRKWLIKILYIYVTLIFGGCRDEVREYEELSQQPSLYPDISGVTIPPNIAPLNFSLNDKEAVKVEAKFFVDGKMLARVVSDGFIKIDQKRWREMISKSLAGDGEISVVIAKCLSDGKWQKFTPIDIKVVDHPIDKYITYRVIDSGYESWNKMGIYQRDLTNFTERVVIENNLLDGSCINCHTNNIKSDQFLFHTRGKVSGSVIYSNGQLKRLMTKSDISLSNFTYSEWHPQGAFIATSTNITSQFFHSKPKKQIEVYDENSDIVLYDVDNNIVKKSSKSISTERFFETYPTWAPDGGRLYFCRADSVLMPQEYLDLKYTLCSVEFNQERGEFSNSVDTIFINTGGSIAFPRLSKCGRYIIFTTLNYGNFPIWHNEADLVIYDLKLGVTIDHHANSDQSDSFHNFSSSGRWLMFTSRRDDTNFTRLYFAFFDENGVLHKPFRLPDDYDELRSPLLKSYNVPCFSTTPIKISPRALANTAKGDIINVGSKL